MFSISLQGYGFLNFAEEEDAKFALEALKLQGKYVSKLFVPTHKLICNYQ